MSKLKKTLKKREKRAKSYKRGGNIEDYIHLSKHISTQQNTDASYKEVGVIHVTEAAAVNALREIATGFANFFGSKGFDNRVFDYARNNALQKLERQIDKRSQKVSNLRMEATSDAALVFIHLYGTLLERESTKPEVVVPVAEPVVVTDKLRRV